MTIQFMSLKTRSDTFPHLHLFSSPKNDDYGAGTASLNLIAFPFFFDHFLVHSISHFLTLVPRPPLPFQSLFPRNNYYGADTASLSLHNLFQKFRNSDPPSTLGHSRDWNLDLVPKVTVRLVYDQNMIRI